MKLRIGGENSVEYTDRQGVMQEWCKWSLCFSEDDVPPPEFLAETGWFPIEKRRYMRVMEVKQGTVCDVDDWITVWPERGVEFELTELFINNSEKWWTLGFEAFGPWETIAEDLIAVSSSILNMDNILIPLKKEDSFSYPQFVSSVFS